MPTKTARSKKREFKRADVSRLQLSYDDLRWECNVKLPDFKTTAELEPLELGTLIGQERAEVALEMALKTPDHVYVAGLTHMHKSFVQKIRQIAGTMPSPKLSDMVCVHNFDDPDRPQFIRLSSGEGVKFKRYVEGLIDKLKEKVPEILRSDAFSERERLITDSIYGSPSPRVAKVESEINGASFDTDKLGTVRLELVWHRNEQQGGFAPSILPIIFYGTDKQGYLNKGNDLSDVSTELVLIEGEVAKYFYKLQQAMQNDNNERAANLEKERKNAKREFVDALFGQETGHILRLYGDQPGVFDFVDHLRLYTLDHIQSFMLQAEGMTFPGNAIPVQLVQHYANDPFLPFRVNVVVDNIKTEGVPIIVDRNPTPARIFGRVAKRGHNGLNEDHTRVKLGALIKADGGILIMPAREALINGVLGRLYAILQSKKLDVGETSDIFGYFSSNIQPSPVEVNCKVIIVGDMGLYNHLSHHEMTSSIFGTVVEFDRVSDQTGKVIEQQLRLMTSFSKAGNLPPFSRSAAIKIMEYSVRLSGSKDTFSLDMRQVKRLMEEAAYWMRHDNSNTDVVTDIVEELHIKQALKKKVYIAGGMRDLMYKMIKDGILIIDIEGTRVGELNSLVVFRANTLTFSAPFKMTAETYGGSGGVGNIESQAGLAGKVFQKSSYIVNARLHSKYADKKSDLGFAASVAMEQSYELVEGDSATLTQYYAIVSDLSGIPLRQNMAVTGSMNQKGRVQPIGGQNEKVEGFFDICNMLGYIKDTKLEKEEDIPGVIIPRRNLRNLVLRGDVLEAVEKDKFRIYAIDDVEEGLEILTGVKAGEFNQFKKYPVGTVNYFVTKRLEGLKAGQEQNKSKKH